MKPALPAPDRIQGWIDAVRPHPYFDALADAPGMLVLRVKKPRRDYQGLHLALSRERRLALADALFRMAAGSERRTLCRVGHPDGRAWFALYTSGVFFQPWGRLETIAAPDLPDDAIHVRYASGLRVVLRLNPATCDALAAWLRTEDCPGRPVPVPLIREERPRSPARRLWVWRWEPDGAGPPDPPGRD